jgi:alcohol dehydrogenase
MSTSNLELRKYVTPEIIFGKDARLLIKRYLSHFGAMRPMIVTDPGVRKQSWFQDIVDEIQLVTTKIEIFDDICPNPRDFEAMMGAELFLSNDCDIIIAIGGGSPIDCAKCISIVSTNGNHILNYEGVDQIKLPGPPLICIPTTSGTSADVSQFAIITDTHNRVKRAIISKKVVPDLALIDPVPLMTMDSYLTACTGMDALTHAIEAYVSNAHSILTDVNALEAIRLINHHIYDAISENRTLETMYQMMSASLQAGLAFSNASLGAVHAMAHSMGGLLDLPHGECNSILLEHVIAMNFESAITRYTDIAVALEIPCHDKTDAQIIAALTKKNI